MCLWQCYIKIFGLATVGGYWQPLDCCTSNDFQQKIAKNWRENEDIKTDTQKSTIIIDVSGIAELKPNLFYVYDSSKLDAEQQLALDYPEGEKSNHFKLLKCILF